MKLPWKTLEKGQGFFIPALDLDPVREAGLVDAVKHRVVDAHAMYCIHQGMVGVLFYRHTKHVTPPAPSRRPKPAEPDSKA